MGRDDSTKEKNETKNTEKTKYSCRLLKRPSHTHLDWFRAALERVPPRERVPSQLVHVPPRKRVSSQLVQVPPRKGVPSQPGPVPPQGEMPSPRNEVELVLLWHGEERKWHANGDEKTTHRTCQKSPHYFDVLMHFVWFTAKPAKIYQRKMPVYVILTSSGTRKLG